MGDNPFDDEDPVASLLGVASDADTIASPHPPPPIHPHPLPPTTPLTTRQADEEVRATPQSSSSSSSSSGAVAKKNEINGNDDASSRGEN